MCVLTWKLELYRLIHDACGMPAGTCRKSPLFCRRIPIIYRHIACFYRHIGGLIFANVPFFLYLCTIFKRSGHLDNGHLSIMTKETLNLMIDKLINGVPCDTTKHWSISNQTYFFDDEYHGSLVLFLNEFRPCWTASAIHQLYCLAEGFDAHLYFESLHGVTTAQIYV